MDEVDLKELKSSDGDGYEHHQSCPEIGRGRGHAAYRSETISAMDFCLLWIERFVEM